MAVFQGEEVETLLSLLGQTCGVVGPGEVRWDLHTQELGAVHTLHCSTIECQRGRLAVCSPEVQHYLLHLLHIQRQMIVTAPRGQEAHLTPVVCIISVADETQHSCIIHKLNEEVGPVFLGVQSWVSRMKRKGAQETSSGGPFVQSYGAGCVIADKYSLRSPCQEVQQPVAQ